MRKCKELSKEKVTLMDVRPVFEQFNEKERFIGLFLVRHFDDHNLFSYVSANKLASAKN